MESYWKNFYTTPTPETENASPLVKQLNRLLIQSGQSTDISRSDDQKYANDWQNFLSSFGGGLNRQA